MINWKETLADLTKSHNPEPKNPNPCNHEWLPYLSDKAMTTEPGIWYCKHCEIFKSEE